MKINNILSSELPEIDNSIKECVNLGDWLLFKPDARSARELDAAFCLKADDNVFLLNEKGGIIRESADLDNSAEIDELYYFSDIAKPDSVENITARQK